MFKRKLKNISDEELVKIIVEKKRHDDFGILYDRYAEKVYHKCISFVKDVDLAQDLAHDVFLKTFLNLAKFEGKSKFSTWLYSLTYNFCIDYLRKNNKTMVNSDEVLVNIPDDDDEKNERELLSIASERLQDVLESIPADDKMILLMKYQDDLSVKEIQGALELSESAVKMRVKRAKAKAVEVYKLKYKDEY
ncbi:MAG: RNA polymerase sigma factor [Flavobacteriales bacterium]|nr:RNA polymerase sigma factor [Flavobacteriales bacterium]